MIRSALSPSTGFFLLTIGGAAAAQTPPAVTHGQRPARFVIRNALVVEGNGTPATGPWDIVVQGNRIESMSPLDPVARRTGEGQRAEAMPEIDAKGKYVLPGLINLHAHLQDDRGGLPQPYGYQLKLWLASGVTSIREVSSGADPAKFLTLKAQSDRGELEAPRLFIYAGFTRRPTPRTVEEVRERVRELKKLVVDGIKIGGMDRDLMTALYDEAGKLGLPIAHHAGVEETNAWDDIRLGTTSIEHWYGVPDAAILDRVQNFPADYNYSDEVDRFRYAGRLWRESDPRRLSMVLDSMVARNVAWDPTLVIYEASRDLTRAQQQPWFKEYLHPTLEQYFRPDPSNHGSYFLGWTTTDEIFWKENYRIWMDALQEFGRKGGLIGAGEDAGFIYQMYGFGLIRELELHQEAGFHPIQAIQHATGNNARILGQENWLGRVRAGHAADLIVVNGNPLENLKVLYPTGVDLVKDGKTVHTGGVEWTIKDGIPYHGPTLLREVGEMVARARAEAPKTSQ
jgi:cytosine/adenosine deaminase-related metal-dependent hydrolase